MKHLLADALPQLPPPDHYSTIGWLVVAVFAGSGGLYYFLKILDRIRGKEPTPPNEQLNQAQASLVERMTKAEGEIANIWLTMRSEDTAIRQQLGKAISDFEGSIGQLDGTLRQVNQTMQLMLQNELTRLQKH